jgi:NAD(P)-dependent dehydrogenase (short-subunit alcohol dehydrogenase family)
MLQNFKISRKRPQVCFSLKTAAAAAAAAVESSSSSMGGRFEGAVVMVTGAGGNFGRAGAVYFRGEGAHVVLLDVMEGPLKESMGVVEQVPGPTSLALVCDITDVGAVAAAVGETEGKFGKITHLWNNAGYQGVMIPTMEYPEADFQRVMNINVCGSFNVLKAVAQSMKKTGGGVIVNTASVAALRGTPTMPAYVASKAAIIGLTMSAAKDLAEFGIRVNAISPALIGPGFMWDRQNELHAKSGSPYFSSDPAQLAKNKINSVPMKRLGSIDEVVKSTAFLLSEDSSYITGTNLIVDGGLAMR